MGEVRTNVEDARFRGEGIEVFGEGLPRPANALVQRRAWDVFDAFHELHEEVVAVGAYGCKADATVAEDGRRDTMPTRWGELMVPRRLPVIVGVGIDEAGSHQRAVGIEHFVGRAAQCADLDDHAAGDGNVRAKRRCAGAVDDGAALQQEVVHVLTS